jgi:septum formation protein
MLVLASTSPRRQQLFSLLGWPFQVISADIDERTEPGETPRQYVLRLAHAKGEAVLPQAPRESLIVAADTAVVDGDHILGKPGDFTQAVEMLQRLRGRTHLVYTGLVVISNESGETLTDLCTTQVLMRDYDDHEIRAYVESGDAYDKAGAYAIQHSGFDPVELLEGCYANVVGLPVCLLTRKLRQLGMKINQICPGVNENNPDDECKIKI